MSKKILKVGGDRKHFWGVRFRPPGQFVEMRTPGWAARVAQQISKGSKVVMGRTRAGNWLIQAVLIRKTMSKRKARAQARKIQRKIEG